MAISHERFPRAASEGEGCVLQSDNADKCHRELVGTILLSKLASGYILGKPSAGLK
jgi:hypothetical protein